MPTEMKSQPIQDNDPAGTEELDPQALAAIRNLFETEKESAAASVPPEEEAMTPPAAQQAVDPVEETVRQSVAAAQREPDPAHRFDEVKPQEPEPPVAKEGFFARLKSRVTGYRPKPKHLVFAALALLVLLRPWLVVGLVLLTIFLFVCVFLILGYDGFWRRAMGIGRWYARRRPSRAAELHRKLDKFAMKWDAILDRFPEGSVDGLYLPDFGDIATADKRHDEALERRFANMREGEA